MIVLQLVVLCMFMFVNCHVCLQEVDVGIDSSSEDEDDELNDVVSVS